MHVILDNCLENGGNLFKYLINCGFICYNFVQTEWHYSSRKTDITCSVLYQEYQKKNYDNSEETKNVNNNNNEF